jgi:Xaa-Pro aminopeptidase
MTDLRDELRRHGVDAWLAPTGDPHLSEYVAERWRTRDWLSGFRGSAGTLVVTHDEACLWVDPRYHMRADRETGERHHGLQAGHRGHARRADLAAACAAAGATLGLDPATSDMAAVQELEARLGWRSHGPRRARPDRRGVDRPPGTEPAAIVPHPSPSPASPRAQARRLRARLAELGARPACWSPRSTRSRGC